jgi:hypothetical protein
MRQPMPQQHRQGKSGEAGSCLVFCIECVKIHTIRDFFKHKLGSTAGNPDAKGTDLRVRW